MLTTEEAVAASVLGSAENDTLSGEMPQMMEDNIVGEEIPVLGDTSEELPSVPALDIKYLKDRPIIITQCILMFLLIILKYTT